MAATGGDVTTAVARTVHVVALVAALDIATTGRAKAVIAADVATVGAVGVT